MSVRGRFGIDWRSVVVGISGEVALGSGWVPGRFQAEGWAILRGKEG